MSKSAWTTQLRLGIVVEARVPAKPVAVLTKTFDVDPQIIVMEVVGVVKNCMFERHNAEAEGIQIQPHDQLLEVN